QLVDPPLPRENPLPRRTRIENVTGHVAPFPSSRTTRDPRDYAAHRCTERTKQLVERVELPRRGVPAADEPLHRAGRRVVLPSFDGADVRAVDVDPDGGDVADGCDGMDVVVGCAAHRDLALFPHLLTGRGERDARGRGFVVAELAFGARVDADYAPGFVAVYGG